MVRAVTHSGSTLGDRGVVRAVNLGGSTLFGDRMLNRGDQGHAMQPRLGCESSIDCIKTVGSLLATLRIKFVGREVGHATFGSLLAVPINLVVEAHGCFTTGDVVFDLWKAFLVLTVGRSKEIGELGFARETPVLVH